jgi:hypothetical protein
MKKSFLIIISFLFIFITSKKCKEKRICSNHVDEEIQNFQEQDKNNNLKYNLANKNIDFSLEGKKLTMNFNGITKPSNLQNPFDDFKVIYIVRFFDKETLGLDNIQAIIELEKPLYRFAMIKLDDEIQDKLSWEVEVQENNKKEQIVQLIAEASSKEKTERFVYDSFTFTYGLEKKEDKTFEFWLIFGGFVGMIIITYCVMTLYILFIDKERLTYKINNASSIEKGYEGHSFQDNSGTTS